MLNRSIVLLGIALAWRASAQSDSLVGTGNMVTPRYRHAATLMKDGQVFLSGGYDQFRFTEIYDPATGTFRATTQLASNHSDDAEILLPDGRVLLAGSAGVSIYDPSVDTFTAVGTINTRGYPTAAGYLPDGRILLAASGVDSYDPRTAQLRHLQDFAGGPGTTRVLPDGRLAVVTADSLWIYELRGDVVQPLIRQEFGSSWGDRGVGRLPDGNILIAGGGGDYVTDTVIGEAFFYDVRRNRLEKLPSPGPRYGHQMVPLSDGRMLLLGGDSNAFDLVSPATQAWNPGNRTFTTVGPAAPQLWGSATALNDGRLLLAGGLKQTSAYIYTPAPTAVSLANSQPFLAPGALAILSGTQLTDATASAPPTGADALAGIRVFVEDSRGNVYPARLLLASPTQVNFEVPSKVVTGRANVILQHQDGSTLAVASEVRAISPGLLTRWSSYPAGYAVRVESDGNQSVIPAIDSIWLDDRPMFLILYASGIRGRSLLGGVQCTIGDTPCSVKYAGPAGENLPGLDQLNLELPKSLRGKRLLDVQITVDGVSANAVAIDFQ